MITCTNQKQTGKPCNGGMSREIDCPHSTTRCLRDCSTGCPKYNNGTPQKVQPAVAPVPTNNVTKTITPQRPVGTPATSGGCGCGGHAERTNVNPYTSRGATY
jgi:hypothetical protein